MIKRILVATDGGAPALRAVEVAAQLAEQLSADIAILHVVDDARAYVPDMGVLDDVVMAELRHQGVDALAQASARMPAGVKVERLLVDGDPADTIIATARQRGADLIVIGSDSRGRLAHFLLGSTADAVIRKAPCPVMSARAVPDVRPQRAPLAAVAAAPVEVVVESSPCEVTP